MATHTRPKARRNPPMTKTPHGPLSIASVGLLDVDPPSLTPEQLRELMTPIQPSTLDLSTVRAEEEDVTQPVTPATGTGEAIPENSTEEREEVRKPNEKPTPETEQEKADNEARQD